MRKAAFQSLSAAIRKKDDGTTAGMYTNFCLNIASLQQNINYSQALSRRDKNRN